MASPPKLSLPQGTSRTLRTFLTLTASLNDTDLTAPVVRLSPAQAEAAADLEKSKENLKENEGAFLPLSLLASSPLHCPSFASHDERSHVCI